MCVLKTSSGEHSDIIAYLNCFAAGIFFATCLLHMIPEVSEQMKEIFETDYPLAECTVAIGFFFVLMLEQLVTRRGGGRVKLRVSIFLKLQNKRPTTLTVIASNRQRKNQSLAKTTKSSKIKMLSPVQYR